MWVTARTAVLTEPHMHDLLQANLWYLRGRDCDLLVDAGNGVAPLLRPPGTDVTFQRHPREPAEVVRGT